MLIEGNAQKLAVTFDAKSKLDDPAFARGLRNSGVGVSW